MTAPSIIEIHPGSDTEGVILSDQVYVVFDQEVDRTTVQILLEGPDTDRWSGPDLVRWDNPDTDTDDAVLASPGYKGLLSGTLTFEKVDESGSGVSGYDYTGNGSLWRTKAVFTPSEPFAVNVQYRVYIVGDEDTEDAILVGASSRTVFDVLKGSNMGDGNVAFDGGYVGTQENTFHVKVIESGEASDGLTFQYWTANAPLIVRELKTKENSQLLADGVTVKFSGDFVINDDFSVFVKPGVRMETTYTWLFTTGSGSISVVPSSVVSSPSVPVGGFDESDGVASSSELTIVETTPVQRATNLDPYSVERIIIKFNMDIDEDTITDETVEVWTEPVNGDFGTNTIQFSGELSKILTVSGDTLIIQIA